MFGNTKIHLPANILRLPSVHYYYNAIHINEMITSKIRKSGDFFVTQSRVARSLQFSVLKTKLTVENALDFS